MTDGFSIKRTCMFYHVGSGEYCFYLGCIQGKSEMVSDSFYRVLGHGSDRVMELVVMKKDGWHDLSFKDLAEKIIGKSDYQFYYGDKFRLKLRSCNCPDMELKRRSKLKIKIYTAMNRLKQFFKRGMN